MSVGLPRVPDHALVDRCGPDHRGGCHTPRADARFPRRRRRQLLCYLPDHEPAIIGDIDQLEAEWVSGSSLARDVDLLIHDCQYTDAEYPRHVGWGHSSLTHALQFARRVAARETLLFHHDPAHTDDDLDAMLEEARTRWTAAGGHERPVSMAAEGLLVTLGTNS